MGCLASFLSLALLHYLSLYLALPPCGVNAAGSSKPTFPNTRDVRTRKEPSRGGAIFGAHSFWRQDDRNYEEKVLLRGLPPASQGKHHSLSGGKSLFNKRNPAIEELLGAPEGHAERPFWRQDDRSSHEEKVPLRGLPPASQGKHHSLSGFKSLFSKRNPAIEELLGAPEGHAERPLPSTTLRVKPGDDGRPERFLAGTGYLNMSSQDYSPPALPPEPSRPPSFAVDPRGSAGGHTTESNRSYNGTQQAALAAVLAGAPTAGVIAITEHGGITKQSNTRVRRESEGETGGTFHESALRKMPLAARTAQVGAAAASFVPPLTETPAAAEPEHEIPGNQRQMKGKSNKNTSEGKHEFTYFVTRVAPVDLRSLSDESKPAKIKQPAAEAEPSAHFVSVENMTPLAKAVSATDQRSAPPSGFPKGTQVPAPENPAKGIPDPRKSNDLTSPRRVATTLETGLSRELAGPSSGERREHRWLGGNPQSAFPNLRSSNERSGASNPYVAIRAKDVGAYERRHNPLLIRPATESQRGAVLVGNALYDVPRVLPEALPAEQIRILDKLDTDRLGVRDEGTAASRSYTASQHIHTTSRQTGEGLLPLPAGRAGGLNLEPRDSVMRADAVRSSRGGEGASEAPAVKADGGFVRSPTPLQTVKPEHQYIKRNHIGNVGGSPGRDLGAFNSSPGISGVGSRQAGRTSPAQNMRDSGHDTATLSSLKSSLYTDGGEPEKGRGKRGIAEDRMTRGASNTALHGQSPSRPPGLPSDLLEYKGMSGMLLGREEVDQGSEAGTKPPQALYIEAPAVYMQLPPGSSTTSPNFVVSAGTPKAKTEEERIHTPRQEPKGVEVGQGALQPLYPEPPAHYVQLPPGRYSISQGSFLIIKVKAAGEGKDRHLVSKPKADVNMGFKGATKLPQPFQARGTSSSADSPTSHIYVNGQGAEERENIPKMEELSWLGSRAESDAWLGKSHSSAGPKYEGRHPSDPAIAHHFPVTRGAKGDNVAVEGERVEGRLGSPRDLANSPREEVRSTGTAIVHSPPGSVSMEGKDQTLNGGYEVPIIREDPGYAQLLPGSSRTSMELEERVWRGGSHEAPLQHADLARLGVPRVAEQRNHPDNLKKVTKKVEQDTAARPFSVPTKQQLPPTTESANVKRSFSFKSYFGISKKKRNPRSPLPKIKSENPKTLEPSLNHTSKQAVPTVPLPEARRIGEPAKGKPVMRASSLGGPRDRQAESGQQFRKGDSELALKFQRHQNSLDELRRKRSPDSLGPRKEPTKSLRPDYAGYLNDPRWFSEDADFVEFVPDTI